MFARALRGWVGGFVFAAAAAVPAGAQVRGHVVLGGSPIGVSVVFGPELAAAFSYGTPAPRPRAVPARYRPGMSLAEFDLYLDRIEHEYEHYRRIDSRDAYTLGWSEGELRDYVRWLRAERDFLRNERRDLRKYFRAEQKDRDRAYREWERDQRRRDRGHGGRGP